jgi:hypothetical protein
MNGAVPFPDIRRGHVTSPARSEAMRRSSSGVLKIIPTIVEQFIPSRLLRSPEKGKLRRQKLADA